MDCSQGRLDTDRSSQQASEVGSTKDENHRERPAAPAQIEAGPKDSRQNLAPRPSQSRRTARLLKMLWLLRRQRVLPGYFRSLRECHRTKGCLRRLQKNPSADELGRNRQMEVCRNREIAATTASVRRCEIRRRRMWETSGDQLRRKLRPA